MYCYVADGYSDCKAHLPDLQSKIKSRLNSLRIFDQWHQANTALDVSEIVNRAIDAGCTTVVAVGGVEIFNEIINSVAANSKVAVGFIPIESCRISRLIGIADWRQACHALAERKISTYRLIAAGQNHSLSSLELGFDTEFAKNVDIKTTKTTGKIKKMLEGLKQTRQYEPVSYNIRADDRYSVSGDLFFLRITNQHILSPDLPDRLTVEIFNKPEKPASLGRLVWSIFEGRLDELNRHYDSKFFASSISIKTKPARTLTADGKIIGRSPIAIRLTDIQIRLITKKTGHGFRADVKRKEKVGIDLD